MARDIMHDLHTETHAAGNLLRDFADVLGEDAAFIDDAIEGQTDLHEAIGKGVHRVRWLERAQETLAAEIADLQTRKTRFKKQCDNIRTALAVAMDTAQVDTVEAAAATVTRKAVPPSAVITNEADIPTDYWKKQDPKLDKTALARALKAGEMVPGAQLSNGGHTVQIRSK